MIHELALIKPCQDCCKGYDGCGEANIPQSDPIKDQWKRLLKITCPNHGIVRSGSGLIFSYLMI